MKSIIKTASETIEQKLLRVEAHIGNTPLIPILGLHHNPDVRIFAKVEWEQLSGSIKARAAFNIIKEALTGGQLNPGKILLDATSGNTGIAYAALGKELGIKVTLLIPENASKERKEILQSLGAELIFTSGFGGTDEAQEQAEELAKKYPDTYFYANQYANENNWKAHYNGTAKEIFSKLPEIDYFVAGLGTTGTFTGTAKKLKEWNPEIITVALQPDNPLHGLEGWKHLETAIIPSIFQPEYADRVLEVSTELAYQVIAEVYHLHGLSLSPSSAANIAGALMVADTVKTGTIVTVLPDNADKYSEVMELILRQ